jgi:hypothetical protein
VIQRCSSSDETWFDLTHQPCCSPSQLAIQLELLQPYFTEQRPQHSPATPQSKASAPLFSEYVVSTRPPVPLIQGGNSHSLSFLDLPLFLPEPGPPHSGDGHTFQLSVCSQKQQLLRETQAHLWLWITPDIQAMRSYSCMPADVQCWCPQGGQTLSRMRLTRQQLWQTHSLPLHKA